MAHRRFLLLATLVGLSVSAAASNLHAQLEYQPAEMVPSAVAIPAETILSGDVVEQEAMHSAATSNPMLWNQYQALQTGTASAADGCQSCGGASGLTDYNRCGCSAGIFPWVEGPGSFDQWCVGPKWGVEANGLFFFREDPDFSGVTTNLIAAEPTTANVLEDPFEHGPGFRLFATAYNEAGYGFQVGYEGINSWTSSAIYTQAPAAAPVPAITRTAIYDSNYNSAEVNFLTHQQSPWKLLTGFRYIQLDEDFLDRPLRDQALPSSAAALLADTGSSHLLSNHLFGFQLGTRRDGWNIGNRFFLETFASAGVYCNKFRRDDIFNTTTTVIVADDAGTADVNEFSQTSSTTTQTARRHDVNQIAFHGEAGVSGVWRLNPCTSLRGGYQILAVDGVGQAVNAFLSPNSGLDAQTLVFHGLQFGLEYRR